MNPRFGIDLIDKKPLLEELLRVQEPLDSIDTQILLREAYETEYRIHDHIGTTDKPLASVAKNVKEDYSEYGPLYRAIYQYDINQIGERWRISLTEFLGLPREIHRLILRITSENATRSTKPIRDQLKDLQKKVDKK